MFVKHIHFMWLCCCIGLHKKACNHHLIPIQSIKAINVPLFSENVNSSTLFNRVLSN